jgi:galactokinase
VTVTAFAPGRVNLIGDHTDYTGGLALPMAIQLGTTVIGEPRGASIDLRSADDDPDTHRYVEAVAAEMQVDDGFVGRITSTLPIGSGLSSSASLEVAVALALGFEGPPLALAELCQRAEQRAVGVPCGIMDQLTIAAGVDGHALLIDFADRSTQPVPIPDGVEVVVVHSGEKRSLAGSAYAERRAECEAAAHHIGPLRDARAREVAALDDAVLRRRARHVVTENERVRTAADALRAGDVVEAGRLMIASHASLRDDFEVSTPALDALVERLVATPGVHGARLTGAGFGGCVVALTRPGVLDEGWVVQPSGRARRI